MQNPAFDCYNMLCPTELPRNAESRETRKSVWPNLDTAVASPRAQALSNLSLLEHHNRQLETEMKSLQAEREKHNEQVHQAEAQLDDLLLQQQELLTESFTLYKQRHDFHRMISGDLRLASSFLISLEGHHTSEIEISQSVISFL